MADMDVSFHEVVMQVSALFFEGSVARIAYWPCTVAANAADQSCVGLATSQRPEHLTIPLSLIQ